MIWFHWINLTVSDFMPIIMGTTCLVLEQNISVVSDLCLCSREQNCFWFNTWLSPSRPFSWAQTKFHAMELYIIWFHTVSHGQTWIWLSKTWCYLISFPLSWAQNGFDRVKLYIIWFRAQSHGHKLALTWKSKDVTYLWTLERWDISFSFGPFQMLYLFGPYYVVNKLNLLGK